MSDKAKLRRTVRDRLGEIVAGVNAALQGHGLDALEPTLTRLGRGGRPPHWFEGLKKGGVLPNPDGKTVGSVIEMLLVGVLETKIFASTRMPALRINPARGVDLPDLDLGVKSPSENYCTSEPFFSSYERLLGGEHDILVLLTDYQSAKRKAPFSLQVVKWKYLQKTQIADMTLCRIARKSRDWLVDQDSSWAQKIFRFLSHVNQSDWRAKHLVEMVDAIQDPESIEQLIESSERDFEKKNARRAKRDMPLIAESDLAALRRIRSITPVHVGVIDAADNWVIETLREAGRFPSEWEWNRYLKSPLDGQIGMSFALQWRYNFGRLFGVESEELSE